MNTDRRVILTLIAMGRITPREAERLLAVWDEGREAVWIAGACCLAVAILELPHAVNLLPGLEHAVKTLLPGAFAVGHHAISIFTEHWGGIV
ncbi:MAG: hypothetical protein WCA11_13365 [Terracidiphilus sp.]